MTKLNDFTVIINHIHHETGKPATTTYSIRSTTYTKALNSALYDYFRANSLKPRHDVISATVFNPDIFYDGTPVCDRCEAGPAAPDNDGMCELCRPT